MYAKPAVGSEIEVVTNTPNPAQPFALPKRYIGRVVESFKWVNDNDVCITTGDSAFPVRVIDLRYVEQMTYLDGTAAKPKTVTAAVPKIQSWTVKGSKGDVYIVTNDDGKWACDCVAGRFGRHCKHVEQIKNSK